MNFKKYIPSFFFLIFAVLLGIFLILKPEICAMGVKKAIILCGRILIPSIFPFGACTLYIIKSGLIEKSDIISPITLRLFGISAYPFFIMVLSMLGGYPIGAKLLNEAVICDRISQKDAEKMLNYCVNAGPSFIISAVGGAILGNNKLGLILMVSHVLASLIICRFSGKVAVCKFKTANTLSPADNFVASASDSANSVLGICSFVILFSVIISYLEYFSQAIPIIKPLIYLCEVTNTVTKTRNIYLISFLLGFSGFCIWCQILFMAKALKINIFFFGLLRILHGALSAFFTYILLKIFAVSLAVFSGNSPFDAFVSSEALGISLLALGIIFIISLSSRHKNIKILEELI